MTPRPRRSRPGPPDPDRAAARLKARLAFHKKLYPSLDLDAFTTHLAVIQNADMMARAVSKFLQPFKLTPPSMGVLIILQSAKEPIPMKAIGSHLPVSQANITGIVDTLEKHALVRRTRHPTDRRVTLLTITDAGRRKLKALFPGLMRLIHSVYGGLPRTEHSTLQKALASARKRLFPLLCAAAMLLPGAEAAADVSTPTLGLAEAVDTAVRGSPSLEGPRAALDAALGAQLRLLGAYDASLDLSIRREDAKTPPTFFFQTAEKTVTHSASLAAAKRFVTGTRIRAETAFSRAKDDVSSVFSMNPTNTSKLDLTVSQPLLRGFLGRPEKAALKESEMAVRSARLTLEREAETLARRAAGAYWSLWHDRKSVAVLTEAREESREFLSTTRKLAKRYEAEKDDLLRAEASLVSKELEVLVAEERVEEGVEDLRAIMSVPAERVRSSALDEPGEPAPAPPAEEALARGLAARRDLRALKISAEKDRLHLKSLSGLGMPDLSVTGGLGWVGLKPEASESFSQLARLGYRSWSLGLTLSYPIGARSDRGEKLQARSAHALSLARTRGLRIEIEREILVAVRRMDLAVRRVAAARRLEAMQSSVLEISRRKYRQGRITSRERLEASNSALAAKSLRIRAEADYAAASAAQKASEGALLEWLGVSPEAYLGERR